MNSPTSNADMKHTPTPWVIYPISNTFKIGTPDMEAFVQRNGYLAGKPFVAEMNVDFSGDAQHEQARLTKRYDRINNVEQAEANARFIVEACNSHARLLAQNEAMRKALKESSLALYSAEMGFDLIANYGLPGESAHTCYACMKDIAAENKRNVANAHEKLAARAALNPPPTK